MFESQEMKSVAEIPQIKTRGGSVEEATYFDLRGDFASDFDFYDGSLFYGQDLERYFSPGSIEQFSPRPIGENKREEADDNANDGQKSDLRGIEAEHVVRTSLSVLPEGWQEMIIPIEVPEIRDQHVKVTRKKPPRTLNILLGVILGLFFHALTLLTTLALVIRRKRKHGDVGTDRQSISLSDPNPLSGLSPLDYQLGSGRMTPETKIELSRLE